MTADVGAILASIRSNLQSSDCDERYFESWTGDGTAGTDRYQQGPGQIDRLWILDVEGRRLVIDGLQAWLGR
jgi:hypothetical protein